MKTHTGDRPHICPNCGQGFMRSTTLRVHLRTHSGEKPYVCDYIGCGRRFAESGNLNAHKKMHNRNKSERGKDKLAKSKEFLKLEQKEEYSPDLLNNETINKMPRLNAPPYNIENLRSTWVKNWFPTLPFQQNESLMGGQTVNATLNPHTYNMFSSTTNMNSNFGNFISPQLYEFQLRSILSIKP